MPDKGNTPPHQESLAPACKFTLNWDQDILEPLKSKWRPAAKDTPATPQHKVKSVVKPADLAALAKIASCGKGRGRVITERLKEIAMGPAASSWYTWKDDVPKKQHLRSPVFQPEKRWKPIEGVRPRKTGLLTTKKRASVSGTSPLGSKLVSLHRKSGHSGSFNRRAKRQTSHVEC